MKILMINKFLHPNGGSETYIFKLGKQLGTMGHEVQYFGMDHDERIVGNRVGAYTANMDFHGGSKLKKLMYPLKTIYSVEARRKIRRVLDDFKPDVCHLNNFNYQLTPSIILEIRKWMRKTGNRCRIVYTAHDYQLVCPNHMCKNPCTHELCEKCLGGSYVNCLKGKCIHESTARSAVGMLEACFWKTVGVYRHIDAIVCCSDFMKRKLDAHPHLAGRTVVMHNFVDPVETETAEKGDYVLYFGRFSREKGTATLLKVAKKLPGIQFVFAGSGPMEGDICGDNVQNVGFRSGDDLRKLIRGARFSVYPSEWYENCPFSVMESLMLGTPVVGADIGGIPEIIKNGVTGELFESGNADDLETVIARLWENDSVAEGYRRNCANIAFDNVCGYTDKLISIYLGLK